MNCAGANRWCRSRHDPLVVVHKYVRLYLKPVTYMIYKPTKSNDQKWRIKLYIQPVTKFLQNKNIEKQKHRKKKQVQNPDETKTYTKTAVHNMLVISCVPCWRGDGVNSIVRTQSAISESALPGRVKR